MKTARNKFNWLRLVTFFTLSLAVLALTSCTSGESTPIAAQDTIEPAAVEAQVTEEAVIVSEVEGTEAVVEETAVTPEPIDECVACHIDKEMLIATADPEEEVISENEGEG